MIAIPLWKCCRRRHSVSVQASPWLGRRLVGRASLFCGPQSQSNNNKVNSLRVRFDCRSRWFRGLRESTVVLLAFVSILATERVVAADFFVASGGSDLAGNGSELSPWRTIQFAIQQIPDGTLAFPNVLKVAAGEFGESSDGTLGQLRITGRNFVTIEGAGSKARRRNPHFHNRILQSRPIRDCAGREFHRD